MSQAYFTNTIQSDFIKSILHSTPLPLYKTIRYNDYIVKGSYYIHDHDIIKCTSSGVFDMAPVKVATFNSQNINDFTVTIGCSVELGYYILGQYSFNVYDPVTKKEYIPQEYDATKSYQKDDIVQYNLGNQNFLYICLQSGATGTWDPLKWKFYVNYCAPFSLIQVTLPGIIRYSATPVTTRTQFALYTTVQKFIPETVSVESYVDKDIYYFLLPETGTGMGLIYSRSCGKLNKKCAIYEKISEYTPEARYTKFTQYNESVYDYHDSYTHRQLGDLLRLYRDIYDLNLMGLYNCWCGDYVPNYSILTTSTMIDGKSILESKIIKDTSDTYKIFLVPVKFNRTYTIALDCSSEVKVAPCLITHDTTVKTTLSIYDYELNDFLKSEIKTYASLVFNNPILYTVNNKSQSIIAGTKLSQDEFLERYERYLYILIQVPKANNSTLTVLEGDFTHHKENRIISAEYTSTLDQQGIDQVATRNLSLLSINDGDKYPVSDKLIEFLLLNAITPQDTIGENITRLCNYIKTITSSDNDSVDYFSNEVRLLISSLVLNQKLVSKLDITGFVDKDVEYYLQKCVK